MSDSELPPAATRVPPGLRVLCVDDESIIGDLVSRSLRRQLKCVVDIARDGQEAMQLLSSRTYDLVLVDFVMPRMDGGELYRRLESEWPDVLPRIMFITGDTLTPATLNYIRSTGRKLLTKPFGLPELTTAIRELIAAQDDGGKPEPVAG